MEFYSTLLLAVALGIDCLIVSFSQGIIFKTKRVKNSLLLGSTMGIFQGLMPCFGYFGTNIIYSYIVNYSKVIVFAVFFLLGLKFIFEAFEAEKEENKIICIDPKCLILLGIVTSIDALASGVSLRLENSPLILSGFLIGLVSFLMSLGGFWFGNFLKNIRTEYLSIAGGLILILLALKALI